jgi:hypothetical protein
MYMAVSVSGSLATVTFSKPVCRGTFWSSTDWTVTINGFPTPVAGDGIPLCNAAADNGITSANLQLINAAPIGALVIVTLNTSGGAAIRDNVGRATVAPQTRTATATGPETTRPTITSASASVGSTTLTINFSEPVFCTGLSFDSSDIFMTDSNPATTDPVVVGAGSNSCGFTPVSADTSFSLATNSAFPPDTTYTVTFMTEPNEIRDVAGNDLLSPSSVTFTTPPGDFTPPTLTDARIVNNINSTDFTDVGDSFSLTFSETMSGSVGIIEIQDLDGTLLSINCLANAICTWNTATTTVTVTLMQALLASGGTTPGLQIPANVASLIGFSDLAGNAPYLLGSVDRVIDFELP